MSFATHYSNGLGEGRGVCGHRAFSLTQHPSRVTCKRCRAVMTRMHQGEVPWPQLERALAKGEEERR